MSVKPHSREKRVVDKTVKVEKRTIDNKKKNKDLFSTLKGLFGAYKNNEK